MVVLHRTGKAGHSRTCSTAKGETPMREDFQLVGCDCAFCALSDPEEGVAPVPVLRFRPDPVITPDPESLPEEQSL